MHAISAEATPDPEPVPETAPTVRAAGAGPGEAPEADQSTEAAVDVEIVVPVYNEAGELADSIERLHHFLADDLPFSWQITIADNASTDQTPTIARWLATELDRVGVLRLEQKGRGRALRAAWSASRAKVVAYMDVDLSTDLRGLQPLVAALLSGHSEVAIGSRLSAGSRVTRGTKRELISRSYNLLLRATLRARFSDAQCGFKAVRADILPELLAEVHDNSWFFDTELLMVAQWRGMRIHEVAVDWVDDPDSRVQILPTAVDDLRGIVRLVASRPLTRFIAVGVASTLSYLLLYLLLAGPLGSTAANAAALTLTTVANTAANRRFTFGVRGRAGLARHHLAGFAVYMFALALTTATIDLLHRLDSHPSRLLEAGVLVLASLGATASRYLALSTWVFGNAAPQETHQIVSNNTSTTNA